MPSASLVGGTGLVGSHILTTLLSTPSITAITTYTRRPLTTSASLKFNQVVDTDTSNWTNHISSLPQSSVPDIFISSLGTTKARAGGLANQRKIDFDLNLLLAKAAKDAGVKTYVLISGGLGGSGGTQSGNAFVRLKSEVENAVKELEFEHTVIVKPGLIVGERVESRPVEAMFRGAAKFLGAVSGGLLKDGWAQNADVIARAAVRAGLKAEETKAGDLRVWEVDQKEILSLGRVA